MFKTSVMKVISGGQTGADIGGIVGARRVGIATGGFAPKGWKTEKGPKPELADYGLVEHESTDYAARTVANVNLADATLIFSRNVNSPGTRKTLSAAIHHNKPHLCLDPGDINAEKEVHEFLEKHHPVILNIAGNRESQSPGISKQVARLIERVLSP
jgi:hypothetical protein